MRRLIECVPNFSEGRRSEVIEALVEPFRRTPGCHLLDYRADPDHNRLVVSVVGDDEPLKSALLQAAKVAVERIDLNAHQGEHPRIGALDVVPFVPIKNASMEECVRLAHDFGRTLNEELDIPVYFYEEAALRPERRRLEVIRRGQFEALKTEIKNPERHPDVGEPRIHPTAGATVVGARKPLIAFNVNLRTTDVEIAKEIAKAIRASSGGLSSVKAIGLTLEERGMVQVSVNVVDHEKNPLYRVLEMVRMEARRWGVEVAETEIYGLAPLPALVDSLKYYMGMHSLSADQIIEARLLDLMGGEG